MSSFQKIKIFIVNKKSLNQVVVHVYFLTNVSGSGKRDLMAQKFFLELLIQSSSTKFEL